MKMMVRAEATLQSDDVYKVVGVINDALREHSEANGVTPLPLELAALMVEYLLLLLGKKAQRVDSEKMGQLVGAMSEHAMTLTKGILFE